MIPWARILELLLVLVVHEGDDELLTPVVGVHADQGAGLAGTGDRCADQRLEVGTGQRGGQVAVALRDGGVGVLETDRAGQVAQRGRLAVRRDRRGDAVQGADVARVGGVVQADLRVGPGGGVHLADREVALEGLQGGQLGRGQVRRRLVRQYDRLVLRPRGRADLVGQEGGVDGGPAGGVQVDRGERDSLGGQLTGDRLDGGAAVVDHEHLQVDPRSHGGHRAGQRRRQQARPQHDQRGCPGAAAYGWSDCLHFGSHRYRTGAAAPDRSRHRRSWSSRPDPGSRG